MKVVSTPTYWARTASAPLLDLKPEIWQDRDRRLDVLRDLVLKYIYEVREKEERVYNKGRRGCCLMWGTKSYGYISYLTPRKELMQNFYSNGTGHTLLGRYNPRTYTYRRKMKWERRSPRYTYLQSNAMSHRVSSLARGFRQTRWVSVIQPDQEG